MLTKLALELESADDVIRLLMKAKKVKKVHDKFDDAREIEHQNESRDIWLKKSPINRGFSNIPGPL